MIRIHVCILLSVFFMLLGCQGRELGNQYSVFVIDQLDSNFKNFLESNGRKFNHSTGVFNISYEGSKVADSFKLISDFYRHQGVDFTDEVIYSNANGIYCCSFEGSLVPYLELYYGEDILRRIAGTVSKILKQSNDMFGCSQCQYDVALRGNSIILSVFGNTNSLNKSDFETALGIGRRSFPYSMIEQVGAEFESDNLIKKFLKSNLALVYSGP